MKFYTDVQAVKNSVLVRGYDADGKRVHKKFPYKPYLFVKSKKKSPFRTVYGEPVSKVEFDCISDAWDFVKKYEKVDNFPIYGSTNWAYTFINDLFPETVEFDPDVLGIGIIDIEVGSQDGFPEPSEAKYPITAITLAKNGKYLVFGCRDYKPHRDNLTYIKCIDETQLISRFILAWQMLDLDIIVGWNNAKFDMPYLVNRIRNVLGEEYVKKLSPWGWVKERRVFTKFGEEQLYDIQGIATIDYLELYQKHSYIPQESYKLDHVASTDIGAKKVDYSEYSSLHKFYEENFQKFVEYNVRDVELIEGLEARHGLLKMAVSLAYDSKINFSDVFGSVRLWDVIIHNELMSQGMVVDPSAHEDKSAQYAGAFVKPPHVGMHEMVASYDVKSLYPSLVVEYNISPETLREHIGVPFTVDTALETGVPLSLTKHLQDENLTLTANGYTWDRTTQGIFPRIIKKIMAQRDEFKAEMLKYKALYEETKDKKYEVLAQRFKVLQQVRKIQLNSLYGCMGNQYFRWFRLEAAEGITLSGQYVIRFVEHWINRTLGDIAGDSKPRVVYVDTDSNYITLADFVRDLPTTDEKLKAVHKLCQEIISPEVDKAFSKIFTDLNGAEKFLFMKLETISDRGIWTAKKRYVLNMHFEEGLWFKEPKIKFTGLEAIKTSTPKVCRDIIKKAVKILLNETPEKVIEYIREEEENYPNRSFDEIAFPRGINGVRKYSHPQTIFTPRTPFHTKGAILYNKALTDRKLLSSYEKIRDGDKIKISYLLMPNPIHSKVISAPGELPKELGLNPYIDYAKMFEKAVVQPLTPIMNAAGVPLRAVPVLDELFETDVAQYTESYIDPEDDLLEDNDEFERYY